MSDLQPAPDAPPETTVDTFVGRTIGGKYKIVKLLGEGGMGCVYLGEQQLGTTTRPVAVKTLHKHLSTDPQVKARFDREVGTIAALEHPNTIQVYDFGSTDDGTLYIVMELVKGKSVGEIIEKEGPMPPDRVEKIFAQVCGSLEEAHGQGIVHRDLKPDNIVLCERAGRKDWVEVLDFGIAKRSDEHDAKEAKLTQQGMVLGTPPYMSPEQFTGQPLDARSDIYALGVMAYEMLTGKLPFEANTAWEWATQHMTAQPKPIEAQPNGAGLPPRMGQAIMKALAKNKTDRPASVKEFYEMLSGTHDAVLGAPTSMKDGAAAAAAPRAKTEIGAPMPDFGAASPAYGVPSPQQAPMGHGPMSPPAQQPYSGPQAYAPQHNVAPAIPPGPMVTAQSRDQGGGKGLLIAAIGIVAILTIVGVAVAMSMNKRNEPAPVSTAATTTATASDTTPTADTSSAATAANTGGTVAPLGGGTGTTTQPTATPTAHGPTGPATAKPSAIPTLKPGGSAAPPPPTTPTAPKTLTPETQSACAGAKMARERHLAAQEASLGEKCRAGGGTY